MTEWMWSPARSMNEETQSFARRTVVKSPKNQNDKEQGTTATAIARKEAKDAFRPRWLLRRSALSDAGFVASHQGMHVQGLVKDFYRPCVRIPRLIPTDKSHTTYNGGMGRHTGPSGYAYRPIMETTCAAYLDDPADVYKEMSTSLRPS